METIWRIVRWSSTIKTRSSPHGSRTTSPPGRWCFPDASDSFWWAKMSCSDANFMRAVMTRQVPGPPLPHCIWARISGLRGEVILIDFGGALGVRPLRPSNEEVRPPIPCACCAPVVPMAARASCPAFVCPCASGESPRPSGRTSPRIWAMRLARRRPIPVDRTDSPKSSQGTALPMVKACSTRSWSCGSIPGPVSATPSTTSTQPALKAVGRSTTVEWQVTIT
mmetsp:Transcript_9053/g.20388  ORF Transcript_9053/g.20388 Transcript_9053/m.20388 type:complete len:224 (-) Transcript_9053:96-767(-)